MSDSESDETQGNKTPVKKIKRRSIFNESWTKEYPWIIKDAGDSSAAMCAVCKKSFSVRYQGLSAVRKDINN